MKFIINENERGFLFKNGEYKKMLLPGKVNVKKFLGESIIKTSAEGVVSIKNVNLNILLKDTLFAKSVKIIEVPDSNFAIHYVDGKATNILNTGTYFYWDIFQKHSYELVDITSPLVDLPREKIALLPSGVYNKYTVSEGEIGLLYFDGEFKEKLNPGTYYYWKNFISVNCQIVDLRKQQLEVNSQEILTADKVSLRLNFVCTYEVSDAVKISNTLKDYKVQIYVTTQLVLREYVGRLKFDELLEQRDNISSVVLERLKEKQESLFVNFLDAGLKDIILPGEIRDIMNTVLIAEKTAQANVIARREEVASTRSLLNTAKLMEENQTLYKLKELEYLEKICDKVGNISVGNGNLLGELSSLLSTRNML